MSFLKVLKEVSKLKQVTHPKGGASCGENDTGVGGARLVQAAGKIRTRSGVL